MASKPTINSSLFKPTVPVEEERSTTPVWEAEPSKTQSTHVTQVPHVAPEIHTQKASDKEITHNTSTRIPLPVHEYFEELAVEHGYSTHSLRIYALSWFVREHKRGSIRLERDRSVRSKRVLAFPEID